jgi:hypothetical protein
MRKPKAYRGLSDVMRWCGVSSRPVISNWIARHPDTVPQPDVIIVSEDTSQVTRGWLPERRAEWEKFAADRKQADRFGSVASASMRRAQSTAALIEEGVTAGRIDPQEAIRLLSELIGRPEPKG